MHLSKRDRLSTPSPKSFPTPVHGGGRASLEIGADLDIILITQIQWKYLNTACLLLKLLRKDTWTINTNNGLNLYRNGEELGGGDFMFFLCPSYTRYSSPPHLIHPLTFKNAEPEHCSG